MSADIIVVVKEAPVSVVQMGVAGPPGAKGDTGPAGGVEVIRTAGQDLSGHRVVAVLPTGEAVYASSDFTTRIPFGLTLGSAISGTSVHIQIGGEITEPSWTWDVTKPVFMGVDGVLTQTPPTSGLLVIVGIPTAPDKLIIDLTDFTIL